MNYASQQVLKCKIKYFTTFISSIMPFFQFVSPDHFIFYKNQKLATQKMLNIRSSRWKIIFLLHNTGMRTEIFKNTNDSFIKDMKFISQIPQKLINQEIINVIIDLCEYRITQNTLANKSLIQQLIDIFQDVNALYNKKYVSFSILYLWLFGFKHHFLYQGITKQEQNQQILDKINDYRKYTLVESLDQLAFEAFFNQFEARPSIYLNFQELFNQNNTQQDIFTTYLIQLQQYQYDYYTINQRGYFIIASSIQNKKLYLQNVQDDASQIEQYLQNNIVDSDTQMAAVSINMNYQPIDFSQQLNQLQMQSLVVFNQRNINLQMPKYLVSLNLNRCHGTSLSQFVNLRILFITDSENLFVNDLQQLSQLECLVLLKTQFNDCDQSSQIQGILNAINNSKNITKITVRNDETNNIQFNPQVFPKLQQIQLFSNIHYNAVLTIEQKFRLPFALIETNIKTNFTEGKPQNVLLHMLEY